MNAAHPLSVTDRTRLRRHPERGRTDRAELYEVLDAGLICHFGVIMDGSPVVLPTAYGRRGDTLYPDHPPTTWPIWVLTSGRGWCRWR